MQFPLDKPVPLDLISRIVKFNLKKREMAQTGIFQGLPAPVRRALESNGIQTLQQLAKKNEAEILQLHGIGKSASGKVSIF